MGSTVNSYSDNASLTGLQLKIFMCCNLPSIAILSLFNNLIIDSPGRQEPKNGEFLLTKFVQGDRLSATRLPIAGRLSGWVAYRW